jgi:hypothetical protein
VVFFSEDEIIAKLEGSLDVDNSSTVTQHQRYFWSLVVHQYPIRSNSRCVEGVADGNVVCASQESLSFSNLPTAVWSIAKLY